MNRGLAGLRLLPETHRSLGPTSQFCLPHQPYHHLVIPILRRRSIPIPQWRLTTLESKHSPKHNANIIGTMAFVSIVATRAMSSATARYGALSTNSIMHILRRFLNSRKTTKSGCSRSHVVGRFSVLLQVHSSIRRVFFASKCFFWFDFNTLSCLARLRSIYLFYR